MGPIVTSPVGIDATSPVGIDVSKLTLDACFLTQEDKKRHRRFANTPAGWRALLEWALALAPERQPCHFALESTGAYSEGVALFLAEQRQKVSVVNPARVRHAALAAGVCNKTDKLDASVIALYCRLHQPPPWQPPAPEFRKLAALVRRRENLLDSAQQEKNRLDQPGLEKEVRASLTRQVRFLDKEIKRVEKDIAAHVQSHTHLASGAGLLESIPGIGKLTAQKILAELGDARGFASSGSAAAYAGLAPQQHQSGTSVRKKTRLSKKGNPHLRKAMYLPTVTALSHNPLVRAFYERLVASGKPKMVALGAAMRKLLMIAVGVLRSGKPFDPGWKRAAKTEPGMAAATAT